MADFHFITDPTTLEIISTILDLAGPNFAPPYDSASQPSDANARNDETLTEYNVPGGTSIKGTGNPAASPSMSMILTGLLVALGPIISAYGFILPILGVIRGIIEILCCLMNPFCVIPAVIRLFTKWIPPFISLFPPAAGAVIIASTIKLILAIVYFIMTEIVPTIELIVKNIEDAVKAVQDKNEAKLAAVKQKLTAVIIDLINRTGVAAAARPLLELIFLILGLVSGFPCGGGKTSSKKIGSLFFGPTTFDLNILDTNCCGDDLCPPEIKNPPSGIGLLLPRFFGDAPPLWTWKLYPITGKANIPKLRPYVQDFKSQLDPQLDEEIDEARPVGYNNDAAHFHLRIMGRRGEKFCADPLEGKTPVGSILVPIARISRNGNVTVTNRILIPWMGLVDYCIEPNYYQLVGHNIMGVGCHPEVEQAKNAVKARFDDLEVAAVDKYPEVSDLPDRFGKTFDNLDTNLNLIRKIVEKPELALEDGDEVRKIRDDILADLFDFATYLRDGLNVVLSRATDKISSSFEVDKHLVRTDGSDKAIVSVTPRDVTGTPIAKKLPGGVDVNVEILTDFGILQNQVRDDATGIVTAELISPFAGTANVMAKVNTNFITNFDGIEESIKIERVKFVADAVLPKRRKVSKHSGANRVGTGITPEREPGSR